MAEAETGEEVVRPIVQLDELTINRIAAGEVIHRPASAIKEMLENSIDAGATFVTITLAAGGLKLLEIADNGHGIRCEDLPLVCERFATSKLTAYADLQSIATFGFRGEALASISHVARVTVTTATAGAQCAFRATYADGKLVPEPGGSSAAPRACARTVGTTITVEDLFANTPTRRRAMRSASDEYARVLDVVGKYALAYPHVAMAVRKAGSGAAGAGHADLTTRGSVDARAAVRAVHGGALAQKLLAAESSDEAYGLRVSLLCSDANWAAKRPSVVVFVNGRLVECAPLAAAIEREYSPFLPRGAHPFALLQLSAPAARVDVNVHPTKADVLLADEGEAIALVQNAARAALGDANSSRALATASAAVVPAAAAGAPRASQATLGNAGDGGSGSGNGNGNGGMLQLRPAHAAASSDRHAADAGAADVAGDVDDGKGGAPGVPPTSHKRTRTLARTGESGGPESGAPEPARTRPAGSSAGTGAAGGGAPAPVYPQHAVRVNRASQRGALDAWVTSASGRTGAPSQPSPRASSARAWAEVTADEDGEGEADEVDAQAVAPHDSMPASHVAAADAAGAAGAAGAGADDLARAADVAAAGSVRAAALSVAVDADCATSGCALTSIRRLLADARSDAHPEVSRALSACVWVGLVRGSSLLVQHDTKLLLLDLTRLSAELFRQLALRRWAGLPRLRFATPAPIDALAAIALRAERAAERASARAVRAADGGGEAQPEAEAVDEAEAEAEVRARAAAVRALLESKAEMLDEYLSVGIVGGCIYSLPQLISGYVPPLCQLPRFVVELATEVDWTAEAPCFAGLASALGALYAVRAADVPGSGAPAGEVADGAASVAAPAASGAQLEGHEWTIRHVLLPRLQRGACFAPPRRCAFDGSVTQVACTQTLYRIFERC
ncbi:hypothetical protein KFE25_002416 [Diacronema lutheri]|uniref:DNA mismatch repair protein S5 domain-containing protein n=1 Tax=Diacronema lutheri TaxID=2081491 RepID=A0A8J6C3Z4_DIALT|nr:hypothetical protein KFE25_002416 [Diacronema lutheri]